MSIPNWMWANMVKTPRPIHNEACEWRKFACYALSLFTMIFLFLIYIERDLRRELAEEDASAKTTVAQIKGEHYHANPIRN